MLCSLSVVASGGERRHSDGIQISVIESFAGWRNGILNEEVHSGDVSTWCVGDCELDGNSGWDDTSVNETVVNGDNFDIGRTGEGFHSLAQFINASTNVMSGGDVVLFDAVSAQLRWVSFGNIVLLSTSARGADTIQQYVE